MRMQIPAGRRPVRLMTTMAAAGMIMAMAGCSGSGAASPTSSFQRGPALTLHLTVYGIPGYRRAGLLGSYERLHPGVRIIERDTAQQSTYTSRLQQQLATGGQAGDLVAIPFEEMPAILARYASRLVPLSTLSGTVSAASTFASSEATWVRQAANRAGLDYAIGAETGPLALCYRPTLLREAGLPYQPETLTQDWSSWAGYLASGRLFAQRIPHGPAFMDSVTSLYNAIVSQASQQYYLSSGRPAVSANPAIKQAWQTAASAAAAHLSARLTPLSSAWATGVTRMSFATAVCPAWMLGTIQHLSGPQGAGSWNVVPVPGGTGNLGGFYLAVPRTSRHQQDAYQLAQYLTGQQAGQALVDVGAFPASVSAINAVQNVINPYFSYATVGRIYGLAADRMPVAPIGPAMTAMGDAMDSALARVEAGTPAASAWASALRQAASASAGG